jgi:serine/threonine protein kinase
MQLPLELGPYRIVERLSAGSVGTVYRAEHTRLKRRVALKILPASRLIDWGAVDRFNREMEVAGRLDHPNIVRAHDAGEVDGWHYLVMGFIDGPDLARLTARTGPLSVADACEVCVVISERGLRGDIEPYSRT